MKLQHEFLAGRDILTGTEQQLKQDGRPPLRHQRPHPVAPACQTITGKTKCKSSSGQVSKRRQSNVPTGNGGKTELNRETKQRKRVRGAAGPGNGAQEGEVKMTLVFSFHQPPQLKPYTFQITQVTNLS